MPKLKKRVESSYLKKPLRLFLIGLSGFLLVYVATQWKTLSKLSKEVVILNRMDYLKFVQLDNSCTERTTISNPRSNPEMHKCPRNVNFRTDLETTTKNNPDYSNFVCRDGFYCMYENVCNVRNKFYFYQKYGQQGKFKVGAFKKPNYRDSRFHTFSVDYSMSITDDPPQQENWVLGTTLWYNQFFNPINHPGHSSEFYTKLVELRKLFPYPIDRIIFAKDRELTFRQDHHQYGQLTCMMMALGFEDTDWQFPDIYWMQYQPQWNESEKVCWERIIVPPISHQHFTSKEAADRYREQALKMCKIPVREDVNHPKKVLFAQRIADRKIANAEELCKNVSATSMGLQEKLASHVEIIEDLPFCQQVSLVYSADIIVTVQGSSSYILAFARPTSSVIIVTPFHFYVPDWKLLAFYSNLRTLELITLDHRNSLVARNRKHYYSPMPQFNLTMIQCFGNRCRNALRHQSTFIPPEHFEMFLKRAVELVNTTIVQPCEIPTDWPLPAGTRLNTKHPLWWVRSSGGFEINYTPCEPPFPNCLCCHNAECKNATRSVPPLT